MDLTLYVWRQASASAPGKMIEYPAKNVSPDMSFLEMLDVVNEDLIERNQEPIAFEHDCREGICGSCSLMINGVPHGPGKGVATCQLHMRSFKDGDAIYIEPFRARAFPVLKDLVVDRSALDRIVQAGGFVSINTGAAQDANVILVSKVEADKAFDAATCIGCGACVATCKNASAMLFVSANISKFAFLPQGQVEREKRAQNMITQMDQEGFGSCSNTLDCEAACPKEISVTYIAKANREFLKSGLLGD